MIASENPCQDGYEKGGTPFCEMTACVRCCKVDLCLVHFHCSRHCHHPSNAIILNTEAHEEQQERFSVMKNMALNESTILLNEMAASNKNLESADPLALVSLQAGRQQNIGSIRKPIKIKQPSASDTNADTPVDEEERRLNPFIRSQTKPKQSFKMPPAVASSEQSILPLATIDEILHQHHSEDSGADMDVDEDELMVHATGQSRLKVRKLLRKALRTSSDETVGPSLSEFRKLAFEIEMCLYKQSGGLTQAYSSKFRSIRHNVADPANVLLRDRILSGDITPAALCEMTTEDLAREDIKMAKEAAFAEAIKAAQANLADEHVTSDYVCPRCGHYESAYRLVTAARDIGKMETWGNKDAAGTLVISVRCLACSHTWLREGML